MGYINVFLSSPCRVFVKNKQLIVQGQEENSFPIEDLNSLLIETGECTLTSCALRTLADAGVTTFVCDEKHLPNGVLLPYESYYRPLKVLDLQLGVSKPLQKQLWQAIIKQKIFNQATCLLLCSDESAEYLFNLSKSVNSDDSKNNEAIAANYYFKKLFGSDFVRRNECFVNFALNYGYSLIRGLIARTLVVYGFESSFGLHHSNSLNNFNLADDLIEPYRPIVDLMVYNMEGNDELTPQVKGNLFSLFNQDVDMNGNVYSLSYAVQLTVQSLKNSLEKGEVNLLLPKVLPLGIHKYE